MKKIPRFAIPLLAAIFFSTPLAAANIGVIFIEADRGFSNYTFAAERAVTTSFRAKGRFSVAPREKLALIAEQAGIGVASRLRADTIRELQKITGVDYLITLTVHSVRQATKGAVTTAEADVSARVYDAHSGRTIVSPRLRETRTETNALTGLDPRGARYGETAEGHALSRIAERLYTEVYSRIEPKPLLTGLVTRIEDTALSINRGTNDGVTVGMIFEFVLPTTNALAAPLVHSNTALVLESDADSSVAAAPSVSTADTFTLKDLTPARLFPESYFEYEVIGTAKVIETFGVYSFVEIVTPSITIPAGTRIRESR